jgi:hypothetical protein
MQGVAEHQLSQLLTLPKRLFEFLAIENPEGVHNINLVFEMPEGFERNFYAAIDRALKNAQQKRS